MEFRLILFPSLLVALVLDVDFERWTLVMVNLSLELNLCELLSGVVIAAAGPLPLRLRTSRGDGGNSVRLWRPDRVEAVLSIDGFVYGFGALKLGLFNIYVYVERRERLEVESTLSNEYQEC